MLIETLLINPFLGRSKKNTIKTFVNYRIIADCVVCSPVGRGAHERYIVVAVRELCLQLGVGPARLLGGLQGGVDFRL
jgi:hypothetical protein